MSGGHYNYLCFKDSTDIGGEAEELEKMTERLKELGFFTIARDTEKIAEAFIGLNEKIEPLRDVWYAVEWYDSGDWTKDQMIEELENYYKKHK